MYYIDAVVESRCLPSPPGIFTAEDAEGAEFIEFISLSCLEHTSGMFTQYFEQHSGPFSLSYYSLRVPLRPLCLCGEISGLAQIVTQNCRVRARLFRG